MKNTTGNNDQRAERRNRWQREYRSEKEKNALLLSDLRATQAQLAELEADLADCERERQYLIAEMSWQVPAARRRCKEGD